MFVCMLLHSSVTLAPELIKETEPYNGDEVVE